jgi:hypothetical protein
VKPIKMVGLATLTALMAMVFIGVSSAAAESTALCLEDPGTGPTEACPEGPPASQLITHVHEATEAGNPALLLSSVVEAKCTTLFLGDVTSENGSGSPLVVLGHFTYSNCKTPSGSSCTVTETSEDATLKILKLGHELADVTYKLEWNVHCGFFINCTYNGENLVGHGLGPLLSTATNGATRLEEQTTHRTGGSFCPEIAKLDLLTTPLEATYVTN